MQSIEEMLGEIKGKLDCLLRRDQVKEWLTTGEVAVLMGRADYTVREWARQGRIVARKKTCGRGKNGEWLISQTELTRLRNEGLLPLQRSRDGRLVAISQAASC